jgi:hypothetical protein
MPGFFMPKLRRLTQLAGIRRLTQRSRLTQNHATTRKKWVCDDGLSMKADTAVKIFIVGGALATAAYFLREKLNLPSPV